MNKGKWFNVWGTLGIVGTKADISFALNGEQALS